MIDNSIVEKAKQIWPEISEKTTRTLVTTYSKLIIPIAKKEPPDLEAIYIEALYLNGFVELTPDELLIISSRASIFNQREFKPIKYSNGIIATYDPELDLLIIKQ